MVMNPFGSMHVFTQETLSEVFFTSLTISNAPDELRSRLKMITFELVPIDRYIVFGLTLVTISALTHRADSFSVV